MPDANLLWSHYRLRVVEYEAILQKQNGLCAICGVKPAKLVVDHCHSTKEVRGLLCYRCNTRLYGLENPEWYSQAVAYLKRYGQRKNYLKRTRRTREQLDTVKRLRSLDDRYANTPPAKQCPACHEVKTREDFYPSREHVNGLERECKACKSQYYKKRYYEGGITRNKRKLLI